MAYLAEVQLPAASKNAADGSSTPATEYGLTMRGHLANVDNGVINWDRSSPGKRWTIGWKTLA